MSNLPKTFVVYENIWRDYVNETLSGSALPTLADIVPTLYYDTKILMLKKKKTINFYVINDEPKT